MEVELRVQFLDTGFEWGEGSDMDFHARTCEKLKGQGENRVSLTALRVGDEQDFAGGGGGVERGHDAGVVMSGAGPSEFKINAYC